VANDPRHTGMAFTKRISIREFGRGLVSLKSNYHLPTLSALRCDTARPITCRSRSDLLSEVLYATMKTWRGAIGEIDDRHQPDGSKLSEARAVEPDITFVLWSGDLEVRRA